MSVRGTPVRLESHWPKVFQRSQLQARGMSATSARSRRPLLPLVVVTVVFACAVLGGWRAVALRAPLADGSTVIVDGTSYRVTQVEQVTGLSDDDLAGMAHGIQGLVTHGQTLVTVSLVVTAGDDASTFDVSALQVFAAGSNQPIPAAGGTLAPGTLHAHASVEGALSFVVPRDGSRLVLRAPGQSHSVPLLQVDVSAPDSTDHSHGDDASPTIVAPVPGPSEVGGSR